MLCLLNIDNLHRVQRLQHISILWCRSIIVDCAGDELTRVEAWACWKSIGVDFQCEDATAGKKTRCIVLQNNLLLKPFHVPIRRRAHV